MEILLKISFLLLLHLVTVNIPVHTKGLNTPTISIMIPQTFAHLQRLSTAIIVSVTSLTSSTSWTLVTPWLPSPLTRRCLAWHRLILNNLEQTNFTCLILNTVLPYEKHSIVISTICKIYSDYGEK